MNIFDKYLEIIYKLIKDESDKGKLILPHKLNSITVEIPPEKFDCDLSTNVAMVLGKINKKPPLILAEQIKKRLSEVLDINEITIVKPGFINIKLKNDYWGLFTKDILSNSKDFGVNLKEKRKTIINMACNAVEYARAFTDDVEFSAEDAGRTNIEFLCEIIEQVIDAGATTINIPDTTGYTMPEEYGRKVSYLIKKIPNIKDAVISIHCHNDLGLAVANSLSAVSKGARQVECTVNGIGERAGNTSMEEFVMALNVRSKYWNLHTDINTKEIYNSSKIVSGYTGILVQPNKAIVGDNAFAHESGIHQDGMLKNRNTYEIMKPESVGITNNKIVLGRHSGRHGLSSRLKILGYVVDENKLNILYSKFLILADKKKEIFDEDLRVLMGDQSNIDNSFYNLDYLNVNLGTATIPTATVRIKIEKKTFEESATGDGPVDACFKAINRAIKFQKKIKLEHYQVRSITAGKAAQGEVSIRLKIDKKAFNGKGISTDTIKASAQAYIQALNHFSLNHSEQKTFLENLVGV